jgi:hypothetical protein
MIMVMRVIVASGSGPRKLGGGAPAHRIELSHDAAAVEAPRARSFNTMLVALDTSREQQKRLGALMGGPPLPAQLGGVPQANAHQITVSYGQTLATLSLAPGDGDLKTLRAAAADKPSARVLELADALRDMIGS